MTTHVFFDPDAVDWSSFLNNQEGRGKYFVGSRYQRGHGILSNIARFVLPIAKNIATTAGQEGLAVGTKILSDMAQGRDIKESLKEHSKQGMENLSSKFRQCGKGRKRPKKIDQLTFM